ncbi:MAG: hypothetical protein ABFD25_13040 [Clostridiaceae bacterium]
MKHDERLIGFRENWDKCAEGVVDAFAEEAEKIAEQRQRQAA